MEIPYILASTEITPLAIENLPERIRGWEILNYSDVIVEEIGSHWHSEDFPIGEPAVRLADDPEILSLAFMHRNPDSCAGFISDNTTPAPWNPYTRRQATMGIMVAYEIVRGLRPDAYIGTWIHEQAMWRRVNVGRTDE